ncbi:hypothetical protein [Sedimentisphaera salicampi]|uniref:Uncharacterized protein n=1 Tax=Sedimentisphaera salicampi TaxID=1941349 RepID=A0A1W6LJB3_9BACT|nr:hypothetical protein [Sedimentisphaera salicampi]ARN55878.1 hypothetical protein STSP1_00245 [Sedimentisphaera salicampi]OXU16069.1 hypothetical protein SMSP1_00238 [Sedimentisphaera salicampi]
MKDLVIKAKTIKKELLIWLLCFLTAFGMNIYSIVKYDNTSFTELITKLHIVVVLSFVLFALLYILRLILRLAAYPFTKNRSKE